MLLPILMTSEEEKSTERSPEANCEFKETGFSYSLLSSIAAENVISNPGRTCLGIWMRYEL